MALTTKSFKELWSKELMPEFKKDILIELKREISKEMQYVAERFESQIHEVRNQLKTIESAQKFISDKYDSIMEMTQATNKELKTMQNFARFRVLPACTEKTSHWREIQFSQISRETASIL